VVLEIALSGLNYFVLMKRVYEPRMGELRAHGIGMLTRIVYIFPFAYLLLAWADVDSVPYFLLAGTYWLPMVLAFEWIGSFILRRPVHEIPRGLAYREGLHVAVRPADLLPLAPSGGRAAQSKRIGRALQSAARSGLPLTAASPATSGSGPRPSAAPNYQGQVIEMYRDLYPYPGTSRSRCRRPADEGQLLPPGP
jgi:hypothetical protein